MNFLAGCKREDSDEQGLERCDQPIRSLLKSEISQTDMQS